MMAAVGTALARWTENPVFTLPTFVWTLLVGAVLRNGLAVTKVHVVDGQALAFAGTVALSLFLAMALMSLRLWELASLALPMLVILTLQASAIASIVTIQELTGTAQAIIHDTFAFYELYLTIAVIYLAITYALVWAFRRLEYRLSGHLRDRPTVRCGAQWRSWPFYRRDRGLHPCPALPGRASSAR